MRAKEFINEDGEEYMAKSGQMSAMGSTMNRGITKKRKKMKEVEQLVTEKSDNDIKINK
jgi:hypothetical protein